MCVLKRHLWRLAVVGLLAVLATVSPAARGNDAAESALPVEVSFNEHIRPIFAAHCVACHGGVKQASGLSFIYRHKALAEGDSGARAIVPGDVEASYLVDRVSDPDPDYRMPPAEHGPPLSEREIALLRQWIRDGATWEDPWAFVPPERHDPPDVDLSGWSRSAVDPFILSRLEQAGLKPSPPAAKTEWLRRVTLDLIGLPPTADQREAFLGDDSPDAFQRVVDRLLASPRFGERWAAVWLDLARYADTMGYEKDPHRDIWPYRDWLIWALNADMPYDQFLVRQLAGDLLPEPTIADRVATAFHRNTQTNTEGGTDDEEFRTAAVLDRVNTTWQVFGGLTFGCTQCHAHPYDPIEHDEYYEFLAVFNQTRDYDLDEELPRLTVPNRPSEWPQACELDQRISNLRRKMHAQLAPLVQQRDQWHHLQFDRTESTGQTRLVARQDSGDAVPEVVTQGTVTSRSMFTLAGPVPEEVQQITAVRIDSLPMDVAEALRNPEMGFVVTRLELSVDRPGDDQPQTLWIRTAVCDEPEPLLDPQAVGDDNNDGWGAYPKIDRPRWAVFVLAEPVEVPPGSRLTLVLKHNRSANGEVALVINRGRYAVSGNPAWTEAVADAEFRQAEEALYDAAAERESIEGTSLPVAEELDAEFRRHTYVFERGNWLDKGREVQPDVPAIFPPIDGEGPVDRLAVARWFASERHPLTARVMVNRAWAQLFGRGLVETLGDLGTSGTRPTHPKLLDDLAVRFQTDMQWSFKQLLRELVLSATYRQRAHATEELLERDPQNRLLARGPRQRLTAEMVRDQALALSGLLADKEYGPSVMPPQPDGVWRSVYSGARWQAAEGQDRYRRAVYTYWKRTSPYPAMMMFDTPTREVCSVRRIATNTPLQPLVTLNDEAMMECAVALGERMASEGGKTAPEQIAWAFRLATCEEPTSRSARALAALYRDAAAAFDDNDEDMQSLGTTAEAYARTIVASAILNLDDVLTR